MLDEADQVPPAFWQSAWLVIVESDEPLPDEPLPEEPRPDGLADGAVDDPEEEPDDGVDIEPLLEPEPVAPVLPELLDPVLPPVVLPPVLLPPLVCAAASAGTKQTIPIKTRVSIFFITPSSLCPAQRSSLCRHTVVSNIQALERHADPHTVAFSLPSQLVAIGLTASLTWFVTASLDSVALSRRRRSMTAWLVK